LRKYRTAEQANSPAIWSLHYSLESAMKGRNNDIKTDHNLRSKSQTSRVKNFEIIIVITVEIYIFGWESEENSYHTELGNRFFWNVGTYLPKDTAAHTIRLRS
jgi:hypothetical protein